MSQFHTDEYVDFLYRVTPENVDAFVREQSKCKCMNVSQLLLMNIRQCGRRLPSVRRPVRVLLDFSRRFYGYV